MTEDGEEEDEEEDDEDEELGAGYLLWFCLLLVDTTPLLQLGLSAPVLCMWELLGPCRGLRLGEPG